jgi:hypothetical protein
MSRLDELQQMFGGYLTGASNSVPVSVIGDDKADARERMDLYAGAYRARLVDSLGVDFPGLWAMLGDEQFYALCLDYIQQHPSIWPSIRWFGTHMSDFLQQNEPYNAYSQVAEMAAFEWAQGLVFDAAQSAVVSLDELEAKNPQDWVAMRLEMIPALQRLDLRWNIPLLWAALDKEDPSPPDLEQQEYPVAWLLWRQQRVPGWRRLDVDEAWALDQARKGMCFAELCEGLLEWLDEQHAPLRAAGFLKTWVHHGLISRIC